MTRRERPKHRTLMLCDELGTRGYMQAFVTASTLLRSSGLQLWSVWPNLKSTGRMRVTLVTTLVYCNCWEPGIDGWAVSFLILWAVSTAIKLWI